MRPGGRASLDTLVARLRRTHMCRMHDLVKRPLEGAGAGIAATAVMSGAMFAAQKAGLLGEMPPRKITAAALDAMHIRRTRREEKAATALTHFGFGAGCGALFSLLGRRDKPSGRAVLEGALFGTAVWAVSYKGWVPALRIMPPPERDRPGRPTSMVIAHWIFGGVLAALLARRSRHRADTDVWP